jgi:hypothetical protein
MDNSLVPDKRTVSPGGSRNYERFSKSFQKSCLLTGPQINTNTDTKFTEELNVEEAVLLNYKKNEIQSVKQQS